MIMSFKKLRTLRSVFQKDGTVTAGNASTINDGAAVCLVMSEKKSKELGIKALAHIVDHVSYSHEPEWFTTAPIFSIEKLLKKQSLQIDDIDLFEINEAFSVVTLATIKNLKLDIGKVNPLSITN